MKPDGGADALEDDDLGIVEQPLPGRAAERGDERAAQRVDGQIDDELAPHRARVGEHHDEHPEPALPAGDRDLADVRPVHLRLLAGQRLGDEVRLALGPRPHERDVLAQRAHGAAIAALANHVVEPCREELGVAVEGVIDERPVRIDDPWPHLRGRARLTETEHATNDVGMDLELGRDGADGPVRDPHEERQAGAIVIVGAGVSTCAQLLERTQQRESTHGGSTSTSQPNTPPPNPIALVLGGVPAFGAGRASSPKRAGACRASTVLSNNAA